MQQIKLTRIKYYEVTHYGQVGAGKIVPFPQQPQKRIIPVPPHLERHVNHMATFIVCGDSLESDDPQLHIGDGEMLICRTRFQPHEIEQKICIVRVHRLDHSARLMRRNSDGTVTLYGYNSKYPAQTVEAGAVEVLAVVVGQFKER